MNPHLKYFIFVFVQAWLACNLTSGVRIGSDGGYEISIAVQETSAIRDDTYLGKLELSIQRFSIQLYISTQQRFFIRTAEVLIPSSWTGARNQSFATSHSYSTADIRVSDLNSYPYTENPNPCGVTGSHIDLPLSFFDSVTESPYGNPAKVLVTQWARYRYGVWEEHGYPSSSKFPYFHENKVLDHWEVTGCSDSPLIGTYVDSHDEESPRCDLENGQPDEAEGCRFKPSLSLTNNATTSLMHFQFIESVSGFCDKATHNHLAPNKQNLFCSSKSIWEVIRTTDDYAALTSVTPNVPPTRVTFVKDQPNPILYVLLDKGTPQLPNLVSKTFAEVSRLFDESGLSGVVASLGTFPRPSSTIGLIERVPWTQVADNNRGTFKSAAESVPDGNANRDFGLAILDAAELIKRKNPPGGAVLFVVKTGTGAGSFADIAYEKEVLGSLTNQKIKIIGLEVRGENDRPNLNLRSLIASLNGDYTIVTSSNIINATIFDNLRAEIVSTLSVPLPDPTQSSTVIFKGHVSFGADESIVIKPNITQMNFYLTVPFNSDVRPSVPPGTTVGWDFIEWDETDDANRRKVVNGYYKPVADVHLNGSIWTAGFTCNANCTQTPHLFVQGTYADPQQSANEPQVSVFTSATDNIVDLNVTQTRNSPFTIFARVQLDSRPVAELNVEALVTSLDNRALSSTVALVDNGVGNPDLSSNDGIYSGIFVPTANGAYKISVRIKNEQVNSNSRVDRVDLRLIPENQHDFGCLDEGNTDEACGAERLTVLYEGIFDLVDAVTFINFGSLIPGKPTMILDLTVPEQVDNEITLSFTAPTLIGVGDATANTRYYVYVARDRSHINEYLETGNTTLSELQIFIGNRPGNAERFSVQPTRFTTGVVWVAVRTLNADTRDFSALTFAQFSTSMTGESAVSNSPPTTDPSVTEGPTQSEPTEETTNPTPTSPTQAPNLEEEKSFWKKTEGIVTIVAIVVVSLVIIGIVGWFCKKRCLSSNDSSA